MRRPLLTTLLLVLLVAGCGGHGDDGPAVAPGAAVEELELELPGEAVAQPLEPRVLVPRERSERAPMLVLLHGQGSSPEAMITAELVAELMRAGERAPIVVLPDGGDASYWHDRDDGAWARMVLEEAIPAAAREHGGDPGRVSVAGFSMGGFGALHLAGEHRFCSVAAHSPAVFLERPRGGSPFAEAFDDRGDFTSTDPVRRAGELPEDVWVDIGDRDPFTPAVRELVEAMPEPRYREWRGDHDFSFFLEQTPRWMSFHLDRLEDCRGDGGTARGA